MSELLDELLARPVGRIDTKKLKAEPDAFTRELEVGTSIAAVTLRGDANEVDESAAAAYLRERGEDPDLWEPTGFRSSDWTTPSGGTGYSVRYTFKRRVDVAARANLDELFAAIEHVKPVKRLPDGEHGALVLLGDMQFGKIDGDGVEGALHRTIRYMNFAAERIETLRSVWPIGEIHNGWLGDHIEGFVSQGGANVWRTPLPLDDQIRLVRRSMLHGLYTFAPLASSLKMIAVPGNHGETNRFNGKGITRYSSSHDTESLIAVKDVADSRPDLYEHVGFLVPELDEMTVVGEIAGTVMAYVHGHQFNVNKHFEWWKGQAFHNQAMDSADILAAGHLHHAHFEQDGPRWFVQVGALESESTWWRHKTGTIGHPGIVLAIVKDGSIKHLEVINDD